MGVSYTVYLLPEAESMGFRPDGATLASTIEALIENQWAQAAETYQVTTGSDVGSFQGVKVRGANLAEDLQALVLRQRGFVLTLPPVPDHVLWPSGAQRSDGKSRQYDFADDETGLFRPCYSDTATLIWSPVLFAVPPEDDCTPVPCPGCGADVLVEFEDRQPATRGLYMAGVRRTVPSVCQKCGASLQPTSLHARVLGWLKAVPPEEPAPFAHFMLALNPSPGAGPLFYPHPIDQGVLKAIKRTTSVTFRHVGRWG
jgi:hypothetical protein